MLKVGEGWRMVPLIAAACLAAGVLGAFFALKSGGTEGDYSTFALEEVVVQRAEAAAPGEGSVLTVAGESDPRVQFPEILASLPGVPADLAYDSVRTLLWFLVVLPDGETLLYGYSPERGEIKSFELPSNPAGAEHSRLLVDRPGDVIVGLDQSIMVADPEAGKYEMVALPKAEPAGFLPTDAAGSITGMAVDADSFWISRMNTATIVRVWLGTLEVAEIPYPVSFGPVDGLAVWDHRVWLLNSFDIEGTAPAALGVFDPSNEIFRTEPMKAYSLASGAQQLWTLSWSPSGVSAVDRDGSSGICSSR